MKIVSTVAGPAKGTEVRPERQPKTGQETAFSAVLNKSMGEKTIPRQEPNVKTIEYTVKPGDTLWRIGFRLFAADPYQIARDNGIANPDLIYPGQKLAIKKISPTEPQSVVASWYGREYHNRPTASGERFDMYQDTVAHKILPFGTKVRLVNPENGLSAVARVNDRGPFIEGRDIDLSYGLADRLGMVRKGVAHLIMEVL